MSDARERLEEFLRNDDGWHQGLRDAIREVLADFEDAQACIDSHGPLRTKVVEQSKEIVRLKAENERMRAEYADRIEDNKWAGRELQKAEALVGELVEALEWIAHGCDVGPEHEAYYACVDKAEAALAKAREGK